jgi:acetyltransferase-like isoleucine patch superfamily enzyme
MASRVGARQKAKSRRYAIIARMRLSGVAMAAQASYHGVPIGQGCHFFGVVRLRRAGHSRLEIGDRCTFRSGRWSNPVGIDRPVMLSTVGGGSTLLIGDDVGLSGTVIAAAEEIVIGNRVLCGVNVTITDADWHGLDPCDRRNGVGNAAPVHIEDDVFIGMRSLVLKGVTIGHGSVIGAGSVVTASIPPLSVAAGSPPG